MKAITACPGQVLDQTGQSHTPYLDLRLRVDTRRGIYSAPLLLQFLSGNWNHNLLLFQPSCNWLTVFFSRLGQSTKS